jgi:TatD DNase family protein
MERAATAGIQHIVSVGMDPCTSAEAVALANRDARVYAAVGIHPWQAAAHVSLDAIPSLQLLAEDGRVVAIGEIGLDYDKNLFTGESFRGEDARAVQRDIFGRQLALAAKRRLPVIVHARGPAHQDIVSMLAGAGLIAPAVIQLQSGADEQAVRAYMRQGCYLSLGGVVTDPREEVLRQAIRTIPLDRLVLETDAPYVAAVWKGSARSEPADLPAIANYVAALMDCPADQLVAAVTANARTLYGLSEIPH